MTIWANPFRKCMQYISNTFPSFSYEFLYIRNYNNDTLGLVHIEVYAIRYLLYVIRFTLRHRQHSSDVAWK